MKITKSASLSEPLAPSLPLACSVLAPTRPRDIDARHDAMQAARLELDR